jgi:hypothetical protein
MNKILWSLLAIFVLPATAGAQQAPGYSGMVLIAKDTYLTINDLKVPSLKPGQPPVEDKGERLGILKIESLESKKGYTFTSLPVTNWGNETRKPSDLEAVCEIPGRLHEYLLAESGYYLHDYGRLFHLRVVQVGSGWQVTVLKVLRYDALAGYVREKDEAGTTYKGDEIEGLFCLVVAGRTYLVFGERGGKSKNGKKAARIVWGEMDFENYQFRMLGTSELVERSLLGDRDCSDLLIRSEKGGWSVWSVATRDVGDMGPFESVVYRAGLFPAVPKPEEGQSLLQFTREEALPRTYRADGLKIEALALPAESVPGSSWSVGTDDEYLGGIWRPLF